MGIDDGQQAHETFDDVVEDLRALRRLVGEPSYAQIAHRIAQARQSRGVEEFAATPARTTVFDAFKLGRSRMDAALVAEIACALGEDEQGAQRWSARVQAARSAKQVGAGVGDPAREPDEGGPRLREAPPTVPAWGVRSRALLVLACVVVNLLGHAVVSHVPLTLFLDMIGTAVAAVVLGPRYGVLVAVVSQSAGVLVYSLDTLAFLPVNVVGALIWGYGARRWMRSPSISRFFVLNLVVAAACSLVATPIIVGAFSGGTGHAGDQLAQALERLGEPRVLSVFGANLFISALDKLLAGFVALAVWTKVSHRSPSGAGSLLVEDPAAAPVAVAER